MFNLIFIFARRIRNADDFVIEVHPRHADYYRRLLLFERIGPERCCPRVAGSPAVLLRLDLETCEREVTRLAGVGRNAQERSLYPLAFDLNKEQAALDFLKRNLKPMSEAEMRHFGLLPQSSAALTALAG
jgi:hypothetical protein